MKLKYQIAVLAVCLGLVGCDRPPESGSDQTGTQPAENEKSKSMAQKAPESAKTPELTQPSVATPAAPQDNPPIASKEISPPVPYETTPATPAQETEKDTPVVEKDTPVEDKDEFLANMDKKLQEFDGRFSEWTVKSATYEDDAKAEADKTLSSIMEKRNLVTQKYEELKKSAIQGWPEAKKEFDSALADLEKALKEAEPKFQ